MRPFILDSRHEVVSPAGVKNSRYPKSGRIIPFTASITECPERSVEEKPGFGVAFLPYEPENQVDSAGNQMAGPGVTWVGGKGEWLRCLRERDER